MVSETAVAQMATMGTADGERHATQGGREEVAQCARRHEEYIINVVDTGEDYARQQAGYEADQTWEILDEAASQGDTSDYTAFCASHDAAITAYVDAYVAAYTATWRPAIEAEAARLRGKQRAWAESQETRREEEREERLRRTGQLRVRPPRRKSRLDEGVDEGVDDA